VLIILSAFDDRPGNVGLMHSLHDYDDGRLLHVVQSVRHALTKPANRFLSDSIGLGLFNIVRVVQDDAITAFTRTHATNRRSKLPTGLIIADQLFANLAQSKPITP
jgi:hypothetical protein